MDISIYPRARAVVMTSIKNFLCTWNISLLWSCLFVKMTGQQGTKYTESDSCPKNEKKTYKKHKKHNKKVSKANKSRTLLRYSMTFHYDLISISSSDASQKNNYVANSTRLPYLDVSGTCISMDSIPYGWFYLRSAFTSVTTCAIGSVVSPRPQRVLPTLCVTLSYISYFS